MNQDNAVAELQAKRDEYHKARDEVTRINHEQARLRELHIAAAAVHGQTKAAYEKARDAFCDAAIAQAQRVDEGGVS